MTTTNNSAGPVKRFDLECDHPSDAQMSEWPDGDYVLFADYDALRAEVEKLQALRKHHRARHKSYKKRFQSEQARAEAAEAGVRLAIRHAERWPDAWNEEDVVKLRAAINEDNSARRGEGL